MNPIIYFISDLHLEADSPNITESFKTFLSKVLTDNSTLYILGDFFEAWIGDDLIDQQTYAADKHYHDNFIAFGESGATFKDVHDAEYIVQQSGSNERKKTHHQVIEFK